MHASRHVPIITFERRMNLAEVAAARQRVVPAPAWALLFAKAYSAVAAKRPELRRAYLPTPWPHLWQADESIAAMANPAKLAPYARDSVCAQCHLTGEARIERAGRRFAEFRAGGNWAIT